MRIKSYFTDSVQEAIEHARIELGPEAMLMNSKKTEPELRALGAYEVVFGVTSDVASASSTVLSKKPAASSEMVLMEKRRPINSSGGISKGLAALLAATQPALDAAAETDSHAPLASPITVNSVAVHYGDVSPGALSPAGLRAGGASSSTVSLLETSVMEPEVPRRSQNHMLENETRQSSAPKSSLLQSGSPQSGDLGRELADLREQIEAVKRSMQQPREWTAGSHEQIPDKGGAAGLARSPDLELSASVAAWPNSVAREIKQELSKGGFSEELAGEIGESVERTLALERPEGSTDEPREAVLYADLSRRFRVAPGLFAVESEVSAVERAILFAGPAGSGKTTSLLKLALRHSLGGRMPVQILTLDTLRVGGWEQLAAYSRIAGLAFNVVHNPAGLGQALAEYRGKKLVLVDTPGLSPREWRETPELAAWVGHEIARDAVALEVQLVVSACMRPAIAQRAFEQFSALRPARLLLTHLDEVDAPGVALELAMRAGLPLSYLTHGQQIPEDLEDASQAALLAPFASAAALSSRVAAAA
jgi:flagellar biosynthesis GTPase FlhF